jgi:hypothetical protein
MIAGILMRSMSLALSSSGLVIPAMADGVPRLLDGKSILASWTLNIATKDLNDGGRYSATLRYEEIFMLALPDDCSCDYTSTTAAVVPDDKNSSQGRTTHQMAQLKRVGAGNDW